MGDITAIQKMLDDKAKGVLSKYGIPNIAAVIVRDQGATVLHTAQGIRDTTKSATAVNNKVNKSDYFNVGSISKPITGFLIACLIKKGVLTWNTTIADVFPEFKSKAFRDRCGMNENFLGTKVYELMAHTSGMNGYYYYALNDDNQRQRDTDPFRFIEDQRKSHGGSGNSRDKEWKNLEVLAYLRYLYTVLGMKQEKYKYSAPQKFEYQNTATYGYGSTCTICVAMVERLTGKPFESIMVDLLSSPLQMQIKFGNLPNGMQMHFYDEGQGKYLPKLAYNNDFAPFDSKFVAGGIHCTVAGMAQFIRYNLRALDHAAIFDIAQYQAPVTDCAKGGLFLGGDLNPELLNHNGETDASFACLYIYPHSGYGYSVMQNCNGGPASEAIDEMFKEVKKIHQNWDNL